MSKLDDFFESTTFIKGVKVCMWIIWGICGIAPCGMTEERQSFPLNGTTDKQKVTCGRCKKTYEYIIL